MAAMLSAVNLAFTLRVFGNQTAGTNNFYLRAAHSWIPANGQALVSAESSANFNADGRELSYRSLFGRNTKVFVCDIEAECCVLTIHVLEDVHYVTSDENFILHGAWPRAYENANVLMIGLRPGRANILVIGPDDIDLDILRVRGGRPLRVVTSVQMRNPTDRQRALVIRPSGVNARPAMVETPQGALISAEIQPVIESAATNETGPFLGGTAGPAPPNIIDQATTSVGNAPLPPPKPKLQYKVLSTTESDSDDSPARVNMDYGTRGREYDGGSETSLDMAETDYRAIFDN